MYAPLYYVTLLLIVVTHFAITEKILPICFILYCINTYKNVCIHNLKPPQVVDVKFKTKNISSRRLIKF